MIDTDVFYSKLPLQEKYTVLDTIQKFKKRHIDKVASKAA